jgi:uncharacterized membrane protein YbhN (UPF0104 family)
VRVAVLAIFGVLLLRIGAAPFVAGLQRLTGPAVLAAAALTGATTLLSAWRWTLISRALGMPLPLRTAVSSYYRSQFLNSVLPGGVTGDLERGLRRTGAARLHALRVVAWDRAAGQVVQLAVLAAVLPLLGVPLLPAGAAVVLAAGVLIGVALLVRRGSRPGDGRLRRAAAAVRRDLRRIGTRPATLLALVGASVLVALMHASVFVLAAVLTGAPVDPLRLLPLALAVQVAMAVPVGFGGLGPREGMAAVVFGGAGLGAAHGVSAAVAYGALALVAVLPGALSLATNWRPIRGIVAPPQRARTGL